MDPRDGIAGLGNDQPDRHRSGQRGRPRSTGNDNAVRRRPSKRWRSLGRSLSAWCLARPLPKMGIEFTYLQLAGESTDFSSSTPATGILARPFQDVTTNNQDSRLLVFPNLVSGSVNVLADSDFNTGEVSLRRVGSSCNWTTLDYYFGYRYANLEDSVTITGADHIAGGTHEWHQL